MQTFMFTLRVFSMLKLIDSNQLSCNMSRFSEEVKLRSRYTFDIVLVWGTICELLYDDVAIARLDLSTRGHRHRP